MVSRRDRLVLTAAVVALAFGNGLSLWSIRHESQQRCVEARQRGQAAAPALRALSSAQLADGDVHTAAVWKQYLDALQRNPLPRC